MRTIIVIGAGPAGMMAAMQAANSDNKIILLERNEKLGRKLAITGKGRCNITNSADLPEFIKNIPGNGKFLYSVFHCFFKEDIMKFFEEHHVPVKIERGGRVFPKSDKAHDVVNALANAMFDAGVEVRLKTKAEKLLLTNGAISGVQLGSGEQLHADALILAAGGSSYPVTGSDGIGVKLAQMAGHHITPLYPALVPLVSDDEWVKSLQGLSLRNVRVRLYANGKKVEELFGEMMFTHFGVTGPIILSMSRNAVRRIAKGEKLHLSINLKPALSVEKLLARVQRDFQKYTRKEIKNAMVDLLPHRLIPIVLDLAFIDARKSVNEISKKECMRLVHILQNLDVDIKGPRPLKEAIVTCGGVNIKEIDPKSMRSKLVNNLYFAGEVIDVDGFTGGYNLQAAFSMGYVAGMSASEEI